VSAPPLLEVRDLRVWFPIRSGLLGRTTGHVRAVDGVDFEVFAGETLGLVGESGSGKSTIGRAILRLTPIHSGEIRFDGVDLAALGAGALRAKRRDLALVFQDPFASLNPRMRVGEIVAEPLVVHRLVGKGEAREKAARELLSEVGLGVETADRYPHELSGGQRQRVVIARALATRPRFVVADEPVSALDVSIQAQVVNLLADLRRRFGLTALFIAHDLSVVRHLSDRIAVLYLGKIAEVGPAEEVCRDPRHPYTVSLLSAVPEPDPARRKGRIVLSGDIPTPIDPLPGCRFAGRCPVARERCRIEEPPLALLDPGRKVACFFPGDLRLP
jgi:oligopeptide/dipeptide ABC transporter ATP-binding protein